MSVMATEKIRRRLDATVDVFISKSPKGLNGVSSRGGTCDVCLRVSTAETGSQKRKSRYSWDRRRGIWGSCHSAAVDAPVGAAGRKGLGDGRRSGRFGFDGASTEHDTTGEDGGLSTIVVGHLVL